MAPCLEKATSKSFCRDNMFSLLRAITTRQTDIICDILISFLVHISLFLTHICCNTSSHTVGYRNGRGGRSEGMSEICSNCEIFITGRSMELISANLTLFFNSFELCGGQTVPSQWGGARLFAASEGHPHENGCNSETKSRKMDPKVPNRPSSRGLQTGH